MVHCNPLLHWVVMVWWIIKSNFSQAVLFLSECVTTASVICLAIIDLLYLMWNGGDLMVFQVLAVMLMAVLVGLLCLLLYQLPWSLTYPCIFYLYD